jgi:hypothetical protein
MNYNDNISDFQEKELYSTTTAKSEQGEGEKSSLGNATKLRTPPKQTTDFIDLSILELVCHETGEIIQQGRLSQQSAINEARKIRFELQDAARNILFRFHGSNVPINNKGYEVHHRTCSCSRFRTGFTSQIVKSKTNNKAFFNGLMNCANSRTCTICSAKISERKSNEMRVAFNIARSEKLNISLLTFTAPHNSGDTLEDLKKGITHALSSFWRGSTAKRFKEKYGIIGNIRSFEIRHGSNGWHPHFHIVIFSKIELPHTLRDSKNKIVPEQSHQWSTILERWQSCCVKSGLNRPNMYGMDIQNGSHAGEYISKFGSDDEILQTKSGKKITWDMADEMTKGNTKTGRKGSSSPWDLLAFSVNGETKEIQYENKKLFLFYARAMQGVNLIRWSRGLRAYFELGDQMTDSEIIEIEEDTADFLCHIQPHEWSYIIKNNLRSVVLQLAETDVVFDDDGLQIDGGYVAVARMLYQGNEFESFDDFLYNFKQRDILVDYVDIAVDDGNTTPIKSNNDLSVSKVKDEFKNYLNPPVLPRKPSPFDRTATKYKNSLIAKSIRDKILNI